MTSTIKYFTVRIRRKTAPVLAAILFASALLFSPPIASAQDAAVAAFFGHWQGSGISESEISLNFRMTARDLDIVIAPQGNGFSLAWTTIQRQKGDPNKPEAVRKSSEVIFQPFGRAGLWHNSQGGQPLAGGTYAWSRIEGNTLITQFVEIDADGRSDLHVYRRTLSGTGMALEFRRLLDGELVRTVNGKLIKIAN